jgi:SAM-dependent methyltransferase
MKLDQHYVDPRLVALYDRDNPRGADTDFYLRLAADLNARRIIDLGCGTGLLTRELAAVEGRQVIGVDPAPAMLAAARQQPGADHVMWVEGDARALGARDADLVVMTGNVAQVFLDDAEWATTLRAIHDTLRPNGHLAFESRTPSARAWERWTRDDTFERIDSPFGPMECWLELVHVGTGLVRFNGHNIFTATGEIIVASSTLRFRSQAELTGSLRTAQFTVEQVYGDWDEGPVTSASGVMIFIASVARRPLTFTPGEDALAGRDGRH